MTGDTGVDLGDEDSCHNLDVRVTSPDGPAREVRLHVLHVHAVVGDGEALVVVAVVPDARGALWGRPRGGVGAILAR